MKRMMAVLALGAFLLLGAGAHAQSTRHSFGFNAASVKGFANAEAFITGGGDFDPGPPAFLKAGGAFRCTRDIEQGPLQGCKAGEGIRWDAEKILTSAPFRCNGAQTVRTAFTNDNTIVMEADFYRQGDGINHSFTGNMIVSTDDIDADQPGIQNVWIQGVGCAEAIVNFH